MRLFRCRRRQRITATTESHRQRRPHRHRARATTTNTLTAMVQAVPTVVTLLLLHQEAHRLLRRARSTRVTMADSRSFIRQQLAHRPATILSLRQHPAARVLQVSPARPMVLRARAAAVAPRAHHPVVVHPLARMLRLPVAAAKEAATAQAVVTVAAALRVEK